MPSQNVIEAVAAALEGALRGVLPEGSIGYATLANIALDAEGRARAPASFQCADGAALRQHHRNRALGALALHRCSTDLTDGFCGPNDGRCVRSDQRSCMRQAESLLAAIESLGMSVVWDHDPNLIITMEKRP